MIDTSQNQIVRAENVQNKDGFYVVLNLPGTTAADDLAYDIFFTAKRPCEVLWVALRYSNTNNGAMTTDVVKCFDGDTNSDGLTLLASEFDLNTTANVLQTRSGLTLAKTGTTQLMTGDSLACAKTGSAVDILNVTVNVYLKYLDRGDYR